MSFLWTTAVPGVLLLCAVLFLADRLVVLSRFLLCILSRGAGRFGKGTGKGMGKGTDKGTDKALNKTLSIDYSGARIFLLFFLLAATLLTPMTVATMSTLLTLSTPPRVLYALLWLFPLALFFLLLEGSVIGGKEVSKEVGKEVRVDGLRGTNRLEFFFARAFSYRATVAGISLWRIAVVVFALCFLGSLLFELLPSAAEIFFQQSARLLLAAQEEITRSASLAIGLDGTAAAVFKGDFGLAEIFVNLSARQIVIIIMVFLLSILGLPFVFSRPFGIIVLLVCLLLPLSLLFYGTLCLLALEQAFALATLASFPAAGVSAGVAAGVSDFASLWRLESGISFGSFFGSFSDTSIVGMLLIFRPGFGFFALACVASAGVASAGRGGVVASGDGRAKLWLGVVRSYFLRPFFWLPLSLGLLLLLFVVVTALPILAMKTWLLGGVGFSSLSGAFVSLYPGESWFFSVSLVLLSLSALLGFSAFGILALRLLSRRAESYAAMLFLPVVVWGAFSDYLSDYYGDFSLIHKFGSFAQGFGSVSQASAALLFTSGLCLILLRRLSSNFSRSSRRQFFLTDRMDEGRVDGGRVDGGSMDGGSMDGGSMDGGSMDGGRVDGGYDRA